MRRAQFTSLVDAVASGADCRLLDGPGRIRGCLHELRRHLSRGVSRRPVSGSAAAARDAWTGRRSWAAGLPRTTVARAKGSAAASAIAVHSAAALHATVRSTPAWVAWSVRAQTRNGLTISRSAQYKDASGAIQQAFDSTTTNSVNSQTSVTGTVTYDAGKRERVRDDRGGNRGSGGNGGPRARAGGTAAASAVCSSVTRQRS